jgi:hypothetical protein
MLVNSGVEFLYFKISGVSLLHGFEQHLRVIYGMKFHIINLLLFSSELCLALFFYAVLRHQYESKTKPLIITSVFMLMVTMLFLGQMINLGIYPLHLAIAFCVSSIVAFPASIVVGANSYDAVVSQSKPV